MNNVLHTPGPWSVIKADRGFIIAANEGAYDVSVVRNIGNQDNEANARLIAAAPELLEAAKAARDVLATAIRANWEGATDDDIADHVTIKRLDAAIAKATWQ